MKKKLLVLFIFILTLGCGQRIITKFVVQRDTPQNPIFTVIPFHSVMAKNEYYNQIVFSHRIEEVLVKLGVKTVNVPAVKSVSKTIKEGSEATEVNEEKLFSSGKKAEETLVEVFFAYEESSADFIIFTNVFNGRVRIVNKNSKEVVATFQITIGSTVSKIEKEYLFEKIIHDALNALGIQVKDLPKPNIYDTTNYNKK